MTTLTSAAANKWIKSLEDEKSYYLSLESNVCEYTLAEGETSTPPEYDYSKVNHEIEQIDSKIRKIKHAINIFNTTTVLPTLNITVDEALVKMAQLNNHKCKLDEMRRRLPKERVDSFSNRAKAIIEYKYANYDIELVKEDYKKVSEEIISIQLALDICNQTQTFEIDL